MNKLRLLYANLSETSKAAFWFTICNCITSGISFLSMPFFTRLMSVDQYGIVVIYNSWLAIISVFATLNLSAGALNNGMVRFYSDRNGYSSAMQGLVFTVSLIFMTASFFLLMLFPSVLGIPVYFFPVMFFQIVAQGIFSLWAARQRYDYLYKPLLLMTFLYAVVVTLGAMIAVCATSDDSIKAFVRVSVSALGSILVALILFVQTQKTKPLLYKADYWKYALRFSIPLLPHYLSLIVLGQVDRIMLGDMIGEDAAAIYAVAYTIGLALSILSSSLNSSLVPWQFEKMRQKDYHGLSKKITNSITALCILGFAFALISPEIMFLFAPLEYQEAVYVMPSVIMGVIFMFTYNVLSNYEFYFEAKKFIAGASLIAAVTKIFLNLIFIPCGGYMAAAYTTVLCYGLLACAHSALSRYVCNKKLGKKDAQKLFTLKNIWSILLIAFVFILGISLLYEMFVVRYVLVLLLLFILLIKRKTLRSLFQRNV